MLVFIHLHPEGCLKVAFWDRGWFKIKSYLGTELRPCHFHKLQRFSDSTFTLVLWIRHLWCAASDLPGLILPRAFDNVVALVIASSSWILTNFMWLKSDTSLPPTPPPPSLGLCSMISLGFYFLRNPHQENPFCMPLLYVLKGSLDYILRWLSVGLMYFGLTWH